MGLGMSNNTLDGLRINQSSLKHIDPIISITPREQIVLLAIGDRDIYGLDLCDRIKRTTNGLHKLSLGAIYPVLQSLEKKGFIESRWGDEATRGARRRYHRCTDLGIAVIKQIVSVQQNLLFAD